MRARNIKPGFYTSDQVADCSVWARLLFPGLWMLADREGRLEDKPRKIKAQIFPYDTVDVDPLLGELNAAGLIVRYTVGGEAYIWIPKFAEHQNPHKKETESSIPPFPGEQGARTDLGTVEQGARTDLGTTKDGPRHERAGLIPDILKPDPGTLKESFLSDSDAAPPSSDPGGRGASAPERETRKAKPKPKVDLRLLDFEVWYSAYPRHQKRAEAQREWERLAKAGLLPPLQTLLDALAWQCRQEQWQNPKYVPLPGSYLHGRQWEDEPVAAGPTPRASPGYRRLSPDEQTYLENERAVAEVVASIEAQEDSEQP